MSSIGVGWLVEGRQDFKKYPKVIVSPGNVFDKSSAVLLASYAAWFRECTADDAGGRLNCVTPCRRSRATSCACVNADIPVIHGGLASGSTGRSAYAFRLLRPAGFCLNGPQKKSYTDFGQTPSSIRAAAYRHHTVSQLLFVTCRYSGSSQCCRLRQSEVAMNQSGKYDEPCVFVKGEGEAGNAERDANGVDDQPQTEVVEYAWDDFTEDEFLSAKEHRQMQSSTMRERPGLMPGKLRHSR